MENPSAVNTAIREPDLLKETSMTLDCSSRSQSDIGGGTLADLMGVNFSVSVK